MVHQRVLAIVRVIFINMPPLHWFGSDGNRIINGLCDENIKDDLVCGDDYYWNCYCKFNDVE